MTTIEQIKVETIFDYFQYRYVVVSVEEDKFSAKRFYDGVVRQFTSDDLIKISLVREIDVHNYIAVDRCGLPMFFPGKPRKNRHGDWEYTQTYEGVEVDLGMVISIDFMKKLTGRILTNADEPVEVK